MLSNFKFCPFVRIRSGPAADESIDVAVGTVAGLVFGSREVVAIEQPQVDANSMTVIIAKEQKRTNLSWFLHR